jgi:hypothetical protein
MTRREQALKLLPLRDHAQKMSEHAIVNFWTRDGDQHDHHHANQMHDCFFEMAALLGYKITKIIKG